MITFTDGGPATTVFCTRQSIILKGRLHLPASTTYTVHECRATLLASSYATTRRWWRPWCILAADYAASSATSGVTVYCSDPLLPTHT